MTPHLEPGTILARSYRLLHPIGEGGMARVWIADHIALARSVAIKVISEEALLTPIARQLFEREARATARVDSPHVVRVLDFDYTDEGFPFLVLELLVGETLEERIARCGALTLRQTAMLVEQLGHAVSAAHACGILHRDIKAENIFLARTRDGSIDARLLDFGVATTKSLSPLVHGTVGTLQYMSPEQLTASEVDERSDVFSLAICVYYALTAQLPFQAQSLGEMAASLARRCTSAVELRPELPRTLDAWFAQALARDPRVRFESAEEATSAFQEALDRCTPTALEVDVGLQNMDVELVAAGVPRGGNGRWLAVGLLVALGALAVTHLDRVASGARWARVSTLASSVQLGADDPISLERSHAAIVAEPFVSTSRAEANVAAAALPQSLPRARAHATIATTPIATTTIATTTIPPSVAPTIVVDDQPDAQAPTPAPDDTSGFGNRE